MADWVPAGDPEVIATHALLAITCVLLLQPESHNTTEGAACLLPAMRLLVGTMQYLSTMTSISQHTELVSKTCVLFDVWAQATRCCLHAAVMAINTARANSTGSAAAQLLVRQLVSSVHFTEHACLAIAVWMLMPAVYEQQRPLQLGDWQQPGTWEPDPSIYALTQRARASC